MELMKGFKKEGLFSEVAYGTPKMILSLSASDLLGLLWSQSRVLCYLNTLSEEEKLLYKKEVLNRIETEFNEKEMKFDFKLQWIEFAKI